MWIALMPAWAQNLQAVQAELVMWRTDALATRWQRDSLDWVFRTSPFEREALLGIARRAPDPGPLGGCPDREDVVRRAWRGIDAMDPAVVEELFAVDPDCDTAPLATHFAADLWFGLELAERGDLELGGPRHGPEALAQARGRWSAVPLPEGGLQAWWVVPEHTGEQASMRLVIHNPTDSWVRPRLQILTVAIRGDGVESRRRPRPVQQTPWSPAIAPGATSFVSFPAAHGATRHFTAPPRTDVEWEATGVLHTDRARLSIGLGPETLEWR